MKALLVKIDDLFNYCQKTMVAFCLNSKYTCMLFQTVEYICRDGMIMISEDPWVTDRVNATCREGYEFDLPVWPECKGSKEIY